MHEVACSAIGGLIVLLLVWFCHSVLPQIVQLFYRHEPTIGGKWNTTFYEGQTEYHETVTLKQKGRKVSGQIVLRLKADKEDSVYTFEGTFKHLILTCTYESTDPAQYEQGVFALKYKGDRFQGQHVLLSKESDEMISSKYEWVR